MEKTLAKGLSVLEALVLRNEPCGVSDLAAALGMSKSNAHRLLNTLLDTGFVNSIDGRYAPSLKVWELGARVIRSYDVRALARPAMTRLVRETAESVRLSVLDAKSLEVVYIDKIDSPQDVRPYSELGGRTPAYCTSSGKAMLAFQDEELIARASRKLKAHTGRSIVDRSAFARAMKKIRAEGFAVNDREYSSQVRGVAAPIFGADGQVIAALSLVAPADRMTPAVLKKVVGLVCEAAARVSAQTRPPISNVVRLPGSVSRPRRKPRKLSA